MLADKLANAPDLFVIPADTKDEKEPAWLSLSGLSWLKKSIPQRKGLVSFLQLKDPT